ncbi:hypothetical protein [Amycolatopsis magusensis]|uniref:Excreted virulence factor EspC, type VII ESX diderm n=1 Tax=Amycolatopsis magusensis TaxID=882444 RepID=A0ABS4PRD8_9PSEU|nr:hypothetical protein [Amycolatopsis magusensis]MBP2181987.1 hypothetical protein [Amycolatopsis magusensis]MDI5982399.1 hypothetical protein [Amycolatopsis magusensis]
MPEVETRDRTAGTAAAFTVAPELAGDAYTRLSELQDVVGEMIRHAKVLGRQVPLGGGYADEVGKFMAEYGIGQQGSAIESLVAFGRELEDLKSSIAEALERYSDADGKAADDVECTGG